MIIRYPTGFYKTVLPVTGDDDTSVTFTISNTEPPRVALNFIQLPYSSRLQSLGWNRQRKNRAAFGNLAMTAMSTKHWKPVDGFKVTNIGQILEFGEASRAEPAKAEDANYNLRHDVSYIDLQRIGIGDSESIHDSVREAFDIAITKLNNLRAELARQATDLASVQTKTSDAQKAKNAVVAAGLTDVAVSIQQKITLLNSQAAAISTEVNSLNEQIRRTTDDINALSTLVK